MTIIALSVCSWLALAPGPGSARTQADLAPVEIEPPPEREPTPAEPTPADAAAPEPESADNGNGNGNDDADADRAPGSDDDDDTEPRTAQEDEPKQKKAKKLSVEFGARVVAGAGLRYEAPARDLDGVIVGPPERRGVLDLHQARASIDLRYREILRVKMSLELSDLLGSPGPGDVLRDAWGNVEVHPAFQIKVGNFKRPYSRFELRGASKIPLIGRGLYNGYAIEDLGWGDRAVGVQLWGKHEPLRKGLDSLGWAVSATTNALAGAPHGIDVHARLTYDPTAWLSIGAGGAFKSVQDALADEPACRSEWLREADCRREVFATNVDVVVRVAGLYAALEADLAQDWAFADESPWMLGTMAYATYDFEVAKRTTLQPVVWGEFVDSNLSYAQSEAVRGVAGLNILWTKHLRILPQAQLVMPLGTVTAFNPFVRQWIVGTWISVQL